MSADHELSRSEFQFQCATGRAGPARGPVGPTPPPPPPPGVKRRTVPQLRCTQLHVIVHMGSAVIWRSPEHPRNGRKQADISPIALSPGFRVPILICGPVNPPLPSGFKPDLTQNLRFSPQAVLRIACKPRVRSEGDGRLNPPHPLCTSLAWIELGGLPSRIACNAAKPRRAQRATCATVMSAPGDTAVKQPAALVRGPRSPTGPRPQD